MASKLIDLTGQRFGRLTVMKLDHFEMKGVHKRPYWLCQCDCGNIKIITSNSLRKGLTKSCGCLQQEVAHNNFYKGIPERRRLYGILFNAKDRCYNENSEYYHNYGGRGITVCNEWMGNDGLEKFIEWALSNGYKEGLTLDRKDNNKGYSPDNCSWETRKHQSNNKRNNVWITLNGETKTLAQWCEKYNVPYARVETRYTKMGWCIEDALFTPRYKKPKGEKAWQTK